MSSGKKIEASESNLGDNRTVICDSAQDNENEYIGMSRTSEADRAFSPNGSNSPGTCATYPASSRLLTDREVQCAAATTSGAECVHNTRSQSDVDKLEEFAYHGVAGRIGNRKQDNASCTSAGQTQDPFAAPCPSSSSHVASPLRHGKGHEDATLRSPVYVPLKPTFLMPGNFAVSGRSTYDLVAAIAASLRKTSGATFEFQPNHAVFSVVIDGHTKFEVHVYVTDPRGNDLGNECCDKVVEVQRYGGDGFAYNAALGDLLADLRSEGYMAEADGTDDDVNAEEDASWQFVDAS